MRPLLLFVFGLLSVSVNSQSLNVVAGNQPPYNANSFIDNFFTGAGIQILDVQFAGDAGSVGFFSDGLDAIGLKRGLILTTGSSASSSSVNGVDEISSDFANTNNGSTAVSAALADIAIQPLYDVVYYKITFRPTSDSIRFRYVFASEEYPEFACSAFNDVFGFFLTGPRPGNGPAYNDFNIALVPGSNLPVAINNVHPANPTYNCPALNEIYYNATATLLQPVYDGFTTPFTAEAAVVPCETYEMVIAIGDVSDGLYDSGVFLEGNSFGGAIEVTSSFAPTSNVIPENAIGDTVFVHFSNLPAAVLPLTITLGGDAENGVDFQTVASSYAISNSDTTLSLVFQPIPDTLTEGFESILIDVNGPGCTARQFTLYIADPDSTMLQSNEPTMYALVNGTAHLEAMPTSFSSQHFTFSNETDVVIDPVGTMISSEIDVTLPFEALSDLQTIESICFNIDHAWVGDLDVYLIAPNDRFVELTTSNGANGDNYTGTCFSPDATNPVNFPGPFAPAGAAPFTGMFKAEGEWSDLGTPPITGAWKLGVADDQSGFVGTLRDWNITFSGIRLGGFSYLWSTGETTPSIEVTQPGLYTVSISNTVSHFEHAFIVADECPHSQLAPQICAGSQFELNGVVFDEAHPEGAVIFDMPGLECDSTVFVQLNVLPATSDSVFAQIASGETFTTGGQTFSEPGNYVIQLSSINGCDSVIYLQLELISGVQIPGESTLNVRPNPVRDMVQLSWGKELIVQAIRIYDRFGKPVLEQQMPAYEQSKRLDVGHLPADTYLMTIQTPDGVVVRKLVKG